MTGSESECETPQKTKKRAKNEQDYKRNKVKKARLMNESYRNYKDHYVPANPHGFDCRCRQKCFDRITEEMELEIYTKFISFESKNQQDAYLQGLIAVQPFKKQRNVGPHHIPQKPKASSFLYQVSTSSGLIVICKTAFLSLHGITADRVRRLCKLILLGKAPKDMRGAGTSKNAIPGATVEMIKGHISEFPVKQTHYGTRNYNYLDEKLNVKLMWRLFSQKFSNVNVEYEFYLKIFKEHFNLSFGRPQVDTCCQCEELKLKLKSPSLNDAAKRVAAGELMIHKRRAKKLFSKMKEISEESKANPAVLGICVDFMQNLQLPAIPVQETFYIRQLTVNVFNIHNLATGKSHFYVYHEGQAKKGPNEVCSLIMKYLENVPSTVKHLHLFSDGCAGQNKNNTVARFCLALVNSGRFQSVNQYFPIRGHSFLPCDRNFSVAKRKLRLVDRYYSMEEVLDIIKSSSVKQHFTVVPVKTEEVLNFKDWWTKFYKKNILSVESLGRNVRKEQKERFNISSYMQLVYQEEERGTIVAYNFIDNLTRRNTFKFGNKPNITLPSERAYNEDYIPIDSKKVNDLQKLFNYIPEEYQTFYREIMERPTIDHQVPEVDE